MSAALTAGASRATASRAAAITGISRRTFRDEFIEIRTLLGRAPDGAGVCSPHFGQHLDFPRSEPEDPALIVCIGGGGLSLRREITQSLALPFVHHEM